MALDSRASYSNPRRSALLLVEVSQLTTLLGATPMTAPDRPALLRRIAEDYVEAAQAFRRDTAQPAAADDEKANLLAKLRRQQLQTAEQGAIATYTALVDTLRLRGESGPELDSARYYLALEDARMGDVAASRRVAGDLLTTSPDSAWETRTRLLLAKLDPAPPPPAPTVTPAPAAVARAPAKTVVPTCSSTIDCPGADVCQDAKCVDPLADSE